MRKLGFNLGKPYVIIMSSDSALLRLIEMREKLSGSKPNILGLAATALYYQEAGQQVTPKLSNF